MSRTAYQRICITCTLPVLTARERERKQTQSMKLDPEFQVEEEFEPELGWDR
jgi:hypothetical protein